jgi:hypothetical protein
VPTLIEIGIFHICLKGIFNLAQPSGLGKEIATSFFFALKGQDRIDKIYIALSGRGLIMWHQTQGVALG